MDFAAIIIESGVFIVTIVDVVHSRVNIEEFKVIWQKLNLPENATISLRFCPQFHCSTNHDVDILLTFFYLDINRLTLSIGPTGTFLVCLKKNTVRLTCYFSVATDQSLWWGNWNLEINLCSNAGGIMI